LDVPPGQWDPPTAARHDGADLGLLVLDGLLQRDLHLACRTFSELRGPEDLLRPWDDASEVASVRGHVTWCALERTRLAWLDGDFAAGVAEWPQVSAMLISRALRRARLLSFRLAVTELRHVDLRMLLLLWHLADRWGRVDNHGVRLDLSLTHEQIGHMIGAHRTSVTVAARKLANDGRVRRGEGGTWVLLGDPPQHLSDLRAGSEPAS